MTNPFAGRWLLFIFLLLLLLVAGCGSSVENGQKADVIAPVGATSLEATPVSVDSTPPVPELELSLSDKDLTVAPFPLRAGFPFTVTAVIRNNSDVPAVDVPVMVYISALQEKIGYTSFLEVLTVTVPASQSVPVEVPVNWNFDGGEHELWVQVNRLPEAWLDRTPAQPEADISDNMVLRDVVVDPFDAYASDLCPGRVDVGLGPADILPEPNRQRVLVRVHNLGNRAVYNLPVVVLGDFLTGIAYMPAIPPCGGTAEVYVGVDRSFQQGESLSVQVNPSEWETGLPEDKLDNNRVSVVAGLAPGVDIPPGSGLDDYDFSISTADIETPEPWIVLVTVRNLGTRDAAMVPIRVENEAGRKITDAIPLVQGEGLGVAAIRVGYL